ncbi:MAG: aminotransferase class IV [Bacteroidales bacterium]|nr:aminotransferase class IV [Bacteroidales bacterium]
MSRHLMLNSEILPADKPCLFADNRGLKYGDSFTIKLRGNSSKAFLLDYNFTFMIDAMKKLKMQPPVLSKKSIFATDLELLLQKNRIYQGFCAEISVFRNTSDRKTSSDNSVSILITVEKADTEWYEHKTTGLRIDVHKKIHIPDYIYNNSLTPIFSPEYLLQNSPDYNQADEWLLTNDKKIILRTTDSILFCVKDKSIIIPKNISPQYLGVFCEFVTNTAIESGIEVYKADVTESDLYNFDELFLCDPTNGIRWILSYKEKRFYHKTSEKLIRKINLKLANS